MGVPFWHLGHCRRAGGHGNKKISCAKRRNGRTLHTTLHKFTTIGGKMKVGDLVVLSARGMASQHNAGFHTGFGMVLSMNCPEKKRYPIKCRWVGGSKDEYVFKRDELKMFKRGE